MFQNPNESDRPGRGGKYSGMLAERKKGKKKTGKEEKGGKKEGKEKEKEKKENRKKEKVTEPISSHFVQGQTLGVGGAPQKEL